MLKYTLTNDEKIPAIVTRGDNSTPVWIQSRWPEEDKYSVYVRHTGCGHCCTSMALNLCGVKINPHEEYTYCREKWGEPRMGEPLFEDNFLSQTGIAEIVNSFNVKAEAFGVPENGAHDAAKHIEKALADGKLVIFWSHPSEKLPDNPFSTGEHYVLFCGFMDDGKILVANSGVKGHTQNGIQFTDIETIEKCIFEGTQTTDYTWGRHNFSKSGAYVVVG